MEECSRSKEAKSWSKLCLICSGFRRDRFIIPNDCHFVFILDPSENSDTFIPRVPDLMFEGLGTMSFCALNSSIYMFESGPCSSKRSKKRKSVYSFDLSAFLSEKDDGDLNISTLKDNSNSMLQPVPPMLGIKDDAASVATPRGQILVFSCRIYYDSGIDFELYDPLTKSWRALPRLCPRREKGDTFRVTAYGFLSESLFCVVTMPEPGEYMRFAQTFALDLDHDHDPESLQWNRRLDISSDDLRGGQFFVLDDELYLTPMGVRRRDNGYKPFSYPSSWSPKLYDYLFRDESLINLSSNQELRFCNVEIVYKLSNEPVFYTTVNAWFCDLAKYKAEKNKECGLSPTRNSFKFVPKVEGIYDFFLPYAILPFGPDAFTSNSSFIL